MIKMIFQKILRAVYYIALTVIVQVHTVSRLGLMVSETMMTGILYWLAGRMNVTLSPWGYQHQIRDKYTSVFLEFIILPYANFTDDWMLIRDGISTLTEVRDWKITEMLMRGEVPLRRVVNWASPEIVGWMLEMGANPNPYEDFGRTALHAAVERADDGLVIARMLLDHGAEVEAVDQRGETPLHRTLRQSYPILPMLKLLVSKGAKVDSLANNSNRTALLIAVKFNQPLDVVKFLVQHGANPLKERAKGGETVLHRASVHQRSDLVDYFLHFGMDVNVRCDSGLTLFSRQVVKDCEPKFFLFLMSRNAMLDTGVLRWMVSCSSDVKHAQEKLRLFLLYAKMEINKAFYPGGLTLTLADIDFCHGGSDWAIPMIEMIALKEFMTHEVEIANRFFVERRRELGNYFRKCKKELKRMKHAQLYGKVTLLNLLTDNVSKVCGYMCNNDMVQALVEKDLEKFPTYRVYLEHVLRYVNEQYELEEETIARLAPLLNLNPHDSLVRMIVNFLVPQDMRTFLSCFEQIG